MTDYWLSKLCFDLKDPTLRAKYKADPAAVLADYPATPAGRKALLGTNVPVLATLVNPYLLRFYFGYIGMSDAEFIGRLRGELPGTTEAENG